MHKCILCPNSTQKVHRKKNITYHSFPIKLERRKKWLKSLKLDNCFQWHRICSEHFDEKDFKPGNKRLLWPYAVPKLPTSLETFCVTRHNIREHFKKYCSTSLESSKNVLRNRSDIDKPKDKRTIISSKLQHESHKTNKAKTLRRSSRKRKFKTLGDELRSQDKRQNKRVIIDDEEEEEVTDSNSESLMETCLSKQQCSNMFTNGLRCCIKNCKTKNSTNISFFGYPRDESIRKIWIQNCGLDDATNSQDNLKANLKVCRLHFEDRMFTNVLKKNRLVLNAIPTLNLNNDFINDNPQQTTSNNEYNVEVNHVSNSDDDGKSVTTKNYQSSTIITEHPTQLQKAKNIPNVYFTDENGHYKCCVPGCTQRNPGELTSLFTPPAIFLNEWSSLLDIKMTEESCVCDKHFKTQDIILSEMDVPNKGKKTVKRLAEYAMPISVKTNESSLKRSIINDDILIKKPRIETIDVSKTTNEIIDLSENEFEDEFINSSTATTSNSVQSSFEKVLPKILANSSISLTLQPSVNQKANESTKVINPPPSTHTSDNLSQKYTNNVLSITFGSKNMQSKQILANNSTKTVEPTKYASKLTLKDELLDVILSDEESSDSSESNYEEISKYLTNKSLPITRGPSVSRNKQLSRIVSTEVVYSDNVSNSSETTIISVDNIQPTISTDGPVCDFTNPTEVFDPVFGIKPGQNDGVLPSNLNDASSTTYDFSPSNKEPLLLKTIASGSLSNKRSPSLSQNPPSNSDRPMCFNNTKSCVGKIVQIANELPSNNVINPEFINNQVSYFKSVSSNSSCTSQSAEMYLPVSNCISLNMENQNLEFSENFNRVLPNDVIFIHKIRKEIVLPNIFWKTLYSAANKDLTVFAQRDELLEVIKQVIFSTSLVPHININGRHYNYNKSIRTKLELENLLEKIDDIQICKGYDGYVHEQCYYYFEDTNSLKNELCDKCKELIKKECLYKVNTIIQHKSNTVEHLINKVSELEARVQQARNRMLQQKRKGNIKNFLKSLGPIEILSGLKPLQY